MIIPLPIPIFIPINNNAKILDIDFNNVKTTLFLIKRILIFLSVIILILRTYKFLSCYIEYKYNNNDVDGIKYSIEKSHYIGTIILFILMILEINFL